MKGVKEKIIKMGPSQPRRQSSARDVPSSLGCMLLLGEVAWSQLSARHLFARVPAMSRCREAQLLKKYFADEFHACMPTFRMALQAMARG